MLLSTAKSLFNSCFIILNGRSSLKHVASSMMLRFLSIRHWQDFAGGKGHLLVSLEAALLVSSERTACDALPQGCSWNAWSLGRLKDLACLITEPPHRPPLSPHRVQRLRHQLSAVICPLSRALTCMHPVELNI